MHYSQPWPPRMPGKWNRAGISHRGGITSYSLSWQLNLSMSLVEISQETRLGGDATDSSSTDRGDVFPSWLSPSRCNTVSFDVLTWLSRWDIVSLYWTASSLWTSLSFLSVFTSRCSFNTRLVRIPRSCCISSSSTLSSLRWCSKTHTDLDRSDAEPFQWDTSKERRSAFSASIVSDVDSRCISLWL